MAQAHRTPTAVSAPDAAASLYLAFSLAAQDYAVPITKVQEIREWMRVTPLPNSPRHVRGVLNLRGTIVPIVDMRLRFSLEEKPYDAFTVIVVVNVDNRLAGLVVDTVNDVLRISGEERCTMSEFEGQASRPFIEGLAQVDGRLLILLDVERLLKPEDLATGTGPNE
ncbi:MAG TPA: chemotaxis protein CheW [Burkholderiaceae bacterium]|nr:chemotaxis protein CheW [Burkholderiaceae bacterium]